MPAAGGWQNNYISAFGKIGNPTISRKPSGQGCSLQSVLLKNPLKAERSLA
jgi:hypothetical protein